MSDRLEKVKTTRLSGGAVEGYRRGTLGRLRRNRGGMAGLYFVLFMVVVWLLSPMLATDQPIVCRYQGRWYFPAVVEVFQSRGGDEHWIEKSRPFNLPQFKARDELAGGGFALWPVICYNEYEQSAEFLAGPSWRHLLGTDELGRDIAARAYLLDEFGAGGGSRTRMEQAPGDFESPASTNFTTPARQLRYLFFIPSSRNPLSSNIHDPRAQRSLPQLG